MALGLKCHIGFLGFGRMGGALAEGAAGAKAVKASQISIFDTDAGAKGRGKKAGFKVAASAEALVAASDIIFLCVKPQQMRPVLESIRKVTPLKNKCFVSIAAGVSLETLQAGLGEGIPVIRVMPNTPALLGAGVSAVACGKNVTIQQKKQVETILGAVGDVVSVEESHMDAVTALSGSGPAYGFYLAEAMTEAGTKLGLDADVARRLVHQTLFGAGTMLAERIEEAGDLRRQVTSPGGTTEAAIREMDERHLKDIIVSAIEKAAQRSRELS